MTNLFDQARLTAIAERLLEAARRAGAHKMSMLQDLQRGRPIEIDVLVDSIAAMREIAGIPTPMIDDLFALLKMRAAVGEYAAQRSKAP